MVPALCMVFPPAPALQPFSWAPLVPPALSLTHSFASWGQEQIHPTETKQAMSAANPLVVEISYGVIPHHLILMSAAPKKGSQKEMWRDSLLTTLGLSCPTEPAAANTITQCWRPPRIPRPTPWYPPAALLRATGPGDPHGSVIHQLFKDARRGVKAVFLRMVTRTIWRQRMASSTPFLLSGETQIGSRSTAQPRSSQLPTGSSSALRRTQVEHQMEKA